MNKCGFWQMQFEKIYLLDLKSQNRSHWLFFFMISHIKRSNKSIASDFTKDPPLPPKGRDAIYRPKIGR